MVGSTLGTPTYPEIMNKIKNHVSNLSCYGTQSFQTFPLSIRQIPPYSLRRRASAALAINFCKTSGHRPINHKFITNIKEFKRSIVIIVATSLIASNKY